MTNKDQYYQLFKENNGQINEIELGEKMGLDENETMIVISQLLSEHKIEYVENRMCSYRINKSLREKWRQ